MELKKKESLDLERKRPLFFNIGLAIALSLTIVAFNWKAEYKLIDLEAKGVEFEPTYIIPATKISDPEPPKPKMEKKEVKKSLQPPVIVETDELEDDTKELLALDQNESNEDFDLSGVIEDIVDEVPEEVLDFVEEMPSFPGGIQAFYQYVSKNMDYPARARRMGIEGKVFVQFIIDQQGNIIEATAVKGIGAGCDEEAVRVLEGAPQWNPGKQRGRAVKVRMRLPISFKLD
ncbi:MAG: energy transducer TonB [Flammeovirgaceae bacterium]|nr:energy transducer TonB [Flammeovirgaceae bacterium]MBE61516.1 energy transducer TonB [Flammeovirgaceae bacterium]|tara:strand:+ start:962 stop:1657 length:696 start_codon:yes stop_codon:yes gene_type:complete